MSPAARAARDFASRGLATIDGAILVAEECLGLTRSSLRDLKSGRETLLAELDADAGDAATERRAVVAFLKREATRHVAVGSGGRLDATGIAIAQLANGIEQRDHLVAPEPRP
jgi:hypothetical protein